jgi:hypothetical protein
MPGLIASSIPVGIDIIGNGGAFMLNRKRKHFDHGLMKTRGPFSAKPRSIRLGMNASQKQGFIGIDISHPSDEPLVEQERLDLSSAGSKQVKKVGQFDAESVGTELAGTRRKRGAPLNPSEMPNVIVNQKPAVKFEYCPCVSPWPPIQQQFARHAEMDRERTVAKLDHNKFAVPANRLDSLLAHLG